jgi:hypothetical protein
VLWLNPQDPESFPTELLEALTSDLGAAVDVIATQGGALENERLRQQMQADALQPLAELEDEESSSLSPSKAQVERKNHFSPEVVEEARAFIRMNVCFLTTSSPACPLMRS